MLPLLLRGKTSIMQEHFILHVKVKFIQIRLGQVLLLWVTIIMILHKSDIISELIFASMV
jgi:hypothetical protein